MNQIFFGPKRVFDPIFLPNIVLDPNLFWISNFFWPKDNLNPKFWNKNFAQNFYAYPFFWHSSFLSEFCFIIIYLMVFVTISFNNTSFQIDELLTILQDASLITLQRNWQLFRYDWHLWVVSLADLQLKQKQHS